MTTSIGCADRYPPFLHTSVDILFYGAEGVKESFISVNITTQVGRG